MDLRGRILEASAKLIEEEGLAALSLREVARRAGVSHQAPYHHFPDKEAILAALAVEGFKQLTARLEQRAQGPGTAGERLLELSMEYLAFALDHPAHFRIMYRPELVNLQRYPEARRAVGETVAVLDVLVEAVIKAASGALPPDVIYTLHVATVHGIAHLMVDGPRPVTAQNREARLLLARQTLEALKGIG